MSTNQYAAFYRINPATVAKAFQQLVDEQVLYKKRGIGMFVSPTARDALYTAARLRPGWDRDYADALFEQVLIIDNGRLVLQDETEALRARGADVTGPAEAVDRFVAGHTVLRERRLGRTKSAMVYGGLDERHRRQAREAGLDLGPVALQDLFVHLTQPPGGPR